MSTRNRNGQDGVRGVLDHSFSHTPEFESVSPAFRGDDNEIRLFIVDELQNFAGWVPNGGVPDVEGAAVQMTRADLVKSLFCLLPLHFL